MVLDTRKKASSKDDLQVIWVCDQCHAVFLFRSDSVIHSQKTGHLHLSAYDFETGRLLDMNKSKR